MIMILRASKCTGGPSEIWFCVTGCREQAELKERLQIGDSEDWQRSPSFTGLERVGGVDLSFIKGDDVNACAQLVVLSYPDMKVYRP